MSRALPPSALPNIAKISTISTRPLRTENGIEYGDLLKFVDFDYVANVARLNAATLASLASSPAPPSDVHLLTKQLENDSKIEWKPAPGATAYEVLWRKTTDADFPEENLQRTTEPKVDLTGLQGQCDFWSTISRCQGPQKPDSDSRTGKIAQHGENNDALIPAVYAGHQDIGRDQRGHLPSWVDTRRCRPGKSRQCHFHSAGAARS